MAIQRMDNVLINVDDLDGAKAFFAELGSRRWRAPAVAGSRSSHPV